MPNMHTCMYVLFERSSDLITLPSAIPEFQEFVRFFCKVEVIISFDARGSDRSLSIVLKL